MQRWRLYRQRETMAKTTPEAPFDHVFRWKNNDRRAKLFGKRCRILAYGPTMRSVLVEFEEGERVITSVRALHKEKT